jgi:hypothetical protein
MGLTTEVVKEGKKRKPVGRYVSEEWAEWLQTNRIELNAMTTPVFLDWLDRKMAEHGQGKVIPPAAVMTEFFNEKLRHEQESSIRERILREADLDGQVQAAMANQAADARSAAEGLTVQVRASLANNPTDSWRTPIQRLAAEMATRSV